MDVIKGIVIVVVALCVSIAAADIAESITTPESVKFEHECHTTCSVFHGVKAVDGVAKRCECVVP